MGLQGNSCPCCYLDTLCWAPLSPCLQRGWPNSLLHVVSLGALGTVHFTQDRVYSGTSACGTSPFTTDQLTMQTMPTVQVLGSTPCHLEYSHSDSRRLLEPRNDHETMLATSRTEVRAQEQQMCQSQAVWSVSMSPTPLVMEAASPQP